MANLKNILLTTDLSTNAIAAIPYAIALAKENGGTIHVFHVLEDEGSEAFASGIVIGVSAWIASVRKQHEAKVRDIAEQIEKDSGVKTIYCVASGIAAKEMVKYVRKFDIDMIVIATHGRTGLPHLILGSVAERVVRLSPVPVLTVRPGEHPAIENFSFQTILMPTDFSDNAAVARPLAVELAKQHHAKLLLAHVVEDSVYYASAAASEGAGVDVEQWLIAICADAEKRLYAEAAMLAKQTELQVESVLSRGRAAEQIVAVAVERKADLIAISTHGYTGLSHLIFGSIAEKVVRISPIPVLSVKPPKIVETTKLFE